VYRPSSSPAADLYPISLQPPHHTHTPADVKVRGPREAEAGDAKSCYAEYMLDVMVVALF
jgi:hypothetical protein